MGHDPCWHMPSPPSDEQTRAGDWRRGLWRLDEAHQALVRAFAVHRRKRLLGPEDPLDGMDLRSPADHVQVAILDLDAAILPPAERDYSGGYSLDYRERVVSLLDGPAPGASHLYLQAIGDAADALAEAQRLERLRTPDEYDRTALRALFAEHVGGSDRAPLIMSVAGHFLAVGARPGYVLGVLDAFDQARCDPPLGSDEVERLVRWIAGRQADRLAGAA